MMFGFGGIFDDIFGRGERKIEKVESDLLMRIRDLEQWAAWKDEDAHERITARDARRSEVSSDDREAFDRAFRIDLEWARLRLFHKDVTENEEYPIEGKKSLAAASLAQQAAFNQNWELAKTLLTQAQAYVRHQGWEKSVQAIETIVKKVNVQSDVTPLDAEGVEKLYTSFEVFDDEIRKHLRNAARAKTPKEWVEAMHGVSKCSLSLVGMVDEQIVEVARQGTWAEWISVAKEGGYSTVVRKLEDKKPTDEIIQVRLRSSEEAKNKTKLGEYLKAFKGDGYKHPNADRLWAIFWWACGFLPPLAPPYGVRLEAQQRDGKWHLMEIRERTHVTQHTPENKEVKICEKFPDGYETKDELLEAAWKAVHVRKVKKELSDINSEFYRRPGRDRLKNLTREERRDLQAMAALRRQASKKPCIRLERCKDGKWTCGRWMGSVAGGGKHQDPADAIIKELGDG